MYNRERIDAVQMHLGAILIDHQRMIASEQYAPSKNADNSDDYIKEQKEFVRKIRKIREDFENLVTGMIGD